MQNRQNVIIFNVVASNRTAYTGCQKWFNMRTIKRFRCSNMVATSVHPSCYQTVALNINSLSRMLRYWFICRITLQNGISRILFWLDQTWAISGYYCKIAQTKELWLVQGDGRTVAVIVKLEDATRYAQLSPRDKEKSI